jgi:4-hydroxy-4-methyl-2-oxoglutarate aldolase
MCMTNSGNASSWTDARLYTAVVADVLDSLGRRDQVAQARLSCYSGQGLLVGPARTLLWEEIDAVDERPYELELQAVDACQPGEVLVCAAAGSTRAGLWGELLSTAASARGCAGAIVDGAVRDVAKMRELGFLCFAAGTCPRDSLHRVRVKQLDVAVQVGGVTIEPGDVVLADDDGLVVVPRAIEREVLARACEKVGAENLVRSEIRAGHSATEVFRKYGVL